MLRASGPYGTWLRRWVIRFSRPRRLSSSCTTCHGARGTSCGRRSRPRSLPADAVCRAARTSATSRDRSASVTPPPGTRAGSVIALIVERARQQGAAEGTRRRDRRQATQHADPSLQLRRRWRTQLDQVPPVLHIRRPHKAVRPPWRQRPDPTARGSNASMLRYHAGVPHFDDSLLARPTWSPSPRTRRWTSAGSVRLIDLLDADSTGPADDSLDGHPSRHVRMER